MSAATISKSTAWHYTVGAYLESILSERYLRLADESVMGDELPIVWFSTRQHWEPTANKLLNDRDGTTVCRLNFAETIAFCKGGWRFGLPVDQLIPWRQLKEAANISRENQHKLTRAGKAMGGDPFFWYGSMDPVAIERCRVEYLDGNTWVDAGLADKIEETRRPQLPALAIYRHADSFAQGSAL